MYSSEKHCKTSSYGLQAVCAVSLTTIPVRRARAGRGSVCALTSSRRDRQEPHRVGASSLQSYHVAAIRISRRSRREAEAMTSAGLLQGRVEGACYPWRVRRRSGSRPPGWPTVGELCRSAVLSSQKGLPEFAFQFSVGSFHRFFPAHKRGEGLSECAGSGHDPAMSQCRKTGVFRRTLLGSSP
jgi:hypothetical protein